jgi:kanamycin nucleotidyltransferase
MTHARRRQLALEIASRVQRHYGDQLLALAVYGSLARGSDGPFSDIEMFCLLRGGGINETLEWSSGPWKAEVNVFSVDTLLGRAAALDVDWSISHGALDVLWVLHDPGGAFPRLRASVFDHPDAVFDHAMRETIVTEIYEVIGKVRNARVVGDCTPLASLAVQAARLGACLIGLAHRHLYTSGARVLAESLSLPGRPTGYDELCQIVMAGQLAQAMEIARTCDAFWVGLEGWAAKRGLTLYQDWPAAWVQEDGRA